MYTQTKQQDLRQVYKTRLHWVRGKKCHASTPISVSSCFNSPPTYLPISFSRLATSSSLCWFSSLTSCLGWLTHTREERRGMKHQVETLSIAAPTNHETFFPLRECSSEFGGFLAGRILLSRIFSSLNSECHFSVQLMILKVSTCSKWLWTLWQTPTVSSTTSMISVEDRFRRALATTSCALGFSREERIPAR